MSAQVEVRTVKALRMMSGEWLGYVWCSHCADSKASTGVSVRMVDVSRVDGSGAPWLVSADQACDCCGAPAADWPREEVLMNAIVEHVRCKVF